MSRPTLDFGIDLGTSNSAIAMLDDGRPTVLRNNDQQELTPSCVMVDRDGTVTVGQRAYERAEVRPDAVAREFKRAMGSNRTWALGGRQWTPEELSAEVLKSLRADAQIRTGETIEAAVVTVPAMFSHPAAEATARAGRLAGLEQVAFLQEPIAAGLAYGLTSSEATGYWLVYDLGGGTFDISLMNLKAGRLTVLDHSGDEFLGGRDFDNVLVDYVVGQLRSDYRLPETLRGDSRYGRLKLQCESAKKALSGTEKTVVDVLGISDDDGRAIEEEVPVLRSDYERLISPQISKTIAIIKRTLTQADLGPSAISQIILVGGPTLTPLVRQALVADTGIAVDLRVDPMTVVAQGAAVFSGTIPTEKRKIPRATTGGVTLDLKYDPVSEDVQSLVGGRISGGPGNQPGLSLELSRSDGWTTGRVPITNGRFVVTVELRTRQVNRFAIRVYDSSGSILDPEPDSLAITQGVVAPDPILSKSFGVAVESDGDAPRTVRLLEKGSRLPATKRMTFRTTRTLAPGTPGVVAVHIVEGESELAESNSHAGRIKIEGHTIQRPLPVGSEVEVRFELDASRRLSVFVFVPLLDQTFPHVIQDVNETVEAVDVLQRRLDAQRDRLQSITDVASVGEAPALLAEAEQAIREAEQHDQDAARKAQRRLEELRGQLDRSVDRARLPMMRREYEELAPEARAFLSEAGDPRTMRQAEDLMDGIEGALQNDDATAVALKLDQLRQLYFGVLLEQPAWWVGLFQDLVQKQAQLTDTNLAKVLIVDGRRALERQDIDALRQVCGRLWSLLPTPDRAGMSRVLPDVGIRL